MGALQKRLAQSRPTVNLTVLEYNLVAALWQESALARITPALKGSLAHKSIGGLVSQIHNNTINAGQAESIFLNLLSLSEGN